MLNEIINGSNTEFFVLLTLMFVGVFFVSIIILGYIAMASPQFISNFINKHPYMAGILLLLYLSMITSFITIITNGMWLGK